MVESKGRERSSADGGEVLPQRWSSRRKADIVLRAEAVLAESIGRYNQEWLVERHGYMTPAEVRESFVQRAA
jgi:hypothetical protein